MRKIFAYSVLSAALAVSGACKKSAEEKAALLQQSEKKRSARLEELLWIS